MTQLIICTFWTCTQVQSFWYENTQFICNLTSIPIPLQINMFTRAYRLIGLQQSNQVPPCVFSCFMLGKPIFSWKFTMALTIDFRKSLVKSVIPLYKATYQYCGRPQKFNKVWDFWTSTNESYAGPTLA